MDIIKTSVKVTKTIKNVSRLKEIITVFARNGFDEIIIKTGLHSMIPNFVIPKSRINEALVEKTDKDLWQAVGYRLRKSFEELGPSFVKIGQLFATREDIFDKFFTAEMKKLHNRVKGIEFSEVEEQIKKAYGKTIQEIFLQFDREPIGTASIGVVYKAKLKDGQDVVVKIKRPGIARVINDDFALLSYIISKIEKLDDEIKSLGLLKLVKDFGESIHTELDFRIEAINCERLRVNLIDSDTENVFHIPKVYKEYTKDNVLVMEYMDGISFSDVDQINKKIDIVAVQLEKAIRIFARTLLADGFFHADLHGGNFFLMDDDRIGLIDFGLVGNLGRKSRINLISILYALINGNYENLAYEFLDVAEYENLPDVDSLTRDIRMGLSPFIGLTVKEIDVSHLLSSVMRTLTKHEIYLPREWFIVFRSLIVLDGVGKTLDMDFNLYSILEGDIKKISKELFSTDRVIEDIWWSSKDIINSFKTFPHYLKWFFRDFTKKNYAIEIVHRNQDKAVNSITSSIKFLAISIFAATLALAGTVLLMNDPDNIHTLTWIFWGLATVLFVIGCFRVKK